MKSSHSVIHVMILVLAISSCHKSGGIVAPASVTVVNAMAEANPVVCIFGNGTAQYFSTAQSIGYTGSLLYTPNSGANPFSVFQISDTAAKILKEALNFNAGGIYSFFMTGDTTNPDILFVRDSIVNYSDSSAGARFVNLSPGSQPVSINLQGNPPTQTEYSNLRYKQISSFKKYNANSSIPGSYTFEIHDQASGNLLTTFSWSYSINKNNTIVIAGYEDPASSYPLTLFQVNYF